MRHVIGTVGQWYLLEDTHERFQLIDEDELTGAIRIQWFDGTLDEIEWDTWRALSAVPVDPPEDWTGPLDVDASDLAEWTDEAPDSAEIFADEREPWEELVWEEEIAMEAEEATEVQPTINWRLGGLAMRRREAGGRGRRQGL